jgi:hypothetical protein
MRQARVGGAHGFHQRIDHLALDAVGEVAGIGDVLEAAPAVGNFLVLGERVGDQREECARCPEGLGERLEPAACACSIGGPATGSASVRALALAVDLEAQAAMVSSNSRFQAARPVTDFSWNSCSMRSSSWNGLSLRRSIEPRPVVAEWREIHQPVDQGIVDQVHLEREEQEFGGRIASKRSFAPVLPAAMAESLPLKCSAKDFDSASMVARSARNSGESIAG